MTLLEKLGGYDALVATVQVLYAKAATDDLLQPLFKGKDVNRLVSMLVHFMQYAFGGAEHYKGTDLYEVHKHMGLTEAHFFAMIFHFRAALKQLGVPREIRDEACNALMPVKDSILGKKSSAPENAKQEDKKPQEEKVEVKEANTSTEEAKSGTPVEQAA